MKRSTQDYVDAIRSSGLSIYDAIKVGDRKLWIPDLALARLLELDLFGMDVNLPPRTRSKLVKTRVCQALGYPVPKSFQRTQPRFPGQKFDVYVQQSNNLQIWNEEIEALRRYVLVFVGSSSLISHVRVLNGEAVALLDKTGTLTQKYQAAIIDDRPDSILVSYSDTPNLQSILATDVLSFKDRRPTELPSPGHLVSIADLFTSLRELVGSSFEDAGFGQERLRGGALHEIVCQQLGYPTFSDNGQMPDILDQLLEVKLQLARTIDLGLVLPNSITPLTGVPTLENSSITHSDLRYAIFFADSDGTTVTIRKLVMSTGMDFFTAFRRFEGKVVNRKLQIPIPKSLYKQTL